MQLHVEPEQLRSTGNRMIHTALDIWEYVSSLRQAVYRLELAWWGGTAHVFLSEVRIRIAELSTRAENLYDFGLLLIRQADSWDESDQRWASTYGLKHPRSVP